MKNPVSEYKNRTLNTCIGQRFADENWRMFEEAGVHATILRPS
jgi:hypothetical protein